jgi:serine protease Do
MLARSGKANQAVPPAAPGIRQAMEHEFPALVRIFVVIQEPAGGRMQRMQAAGSGAIISPEGYVVTNHHVAGNASRIMVNLANHEEIEATLVGTDPLADIAVLKLRLDTRKDPSAPLPVASWGDSDSLRVGDTVLAMGSPGALSQSVTQGIVANTSLIMPAFQQGAFKLDGEDVGSIVRWIAHDAVIFGGNSGGPLVNLEGQIVGINEIGMASLSGAIPSNLARQIAEQLIRTGDVPRSWIGIELQPRLKEDSRSTGVLVGGVLDDSPAKAAGLEPGDLITRYDGAEVNVAVGEDLPPLNQRIFSTPIGKTVAVDFIRGNDNRTTQITTVRRPRPEAKPVELKAWGMTARDLTPFIAREKQRPSTRGVLVDSLRTGGAAFEAKPNLAPGDIITHAGGKEIQNGEDLVKITADLLEGKTERQPLLVCFDRGDAHMITVVHVGQDEPEHKTASARKAWPAMSTQVLTAELSLALGLKDQKGVYVVELVPGKAAEKAGIKVGDIITAMGGIKVDASQPEDDGVFADLVRRFPVGREVEVAVLRDGQPRTLSMKLTAAPGNDDAARLESSDFEFTARAMTFDDRARLKLDDEAAGAIVEKVEPAGWAALGGIAGGDVIMSIDGAPVGGIDQLKSILEKARQTKPRRLAIFIRRGIHTMYREIEPDWK